MTRQQIIKKAVLGAIVLGIGGRWWLGAREPVVNIPNRALPNPNAYDVYVRATKQLSREKDAGDALPIAEKPAKMTKTQRTALVRENAPALATLRSGLALEYGEPPARSFTDLFPYLAGYRSLTRMLVVEGNSKKEAGDMSGAASSYLDAVQFGGHVANGGPLIHRLVSLACEAIGRKALWQSIQQLDAPTAKAATRRMETISARHIPLARTFEEEKYLAQSSMLELFRNPTALKEAYAQTDSDSDNDSAEHAANKYAAANFMYLIWSKQTIIDNNTRYMDELCRQAALPYAARKPIPVPSDILNAILLPVFGGAQIKDVTTQTEDALLTTALALQAYKKEHQGTAPATLNDLAGAYLSQVPNDPFSVDGKTPLRYYRTEHGFTLYSVGPDGKDDGGKAIDNPKSHTESERHRIEADSKGDIVAGINLS